MYPTTLPSVEIAVKRLFFVNDDRRAYLGILAEKRAG
jgi:hypothetical protein